MNRYFAYGSNMNEAQMKERCPSAKVIGVGKLNDYDLEFTIFAPHRNCGAADIVARPGMSVYGVVYELSNVDMEALDLIEGSPVHYRRIPVQVEMDKENVDAWAYEVVSKSKDLLPSSHYLTLLKEAAALHDFPSEYRAKLDAILPS